LENPGVLTTPNPSLKKGGEFLGTLFLKKGGWREISAKTGFVFKNLNSFTISIHPTIHSSYKS
jgi:hypothetical protein